MSLCPVCGKNEVGEVSDGMWLPVCESCQNKPSEESKEKTEAKIEREPTISSRSVAMYKLFTEALGSDTKVVYYPSCDVDVSPTEGFPNSQIFFVDLNPEAVEVLKKKGFSAECADVNNFSLPESADVVILLNPVVPPDGPIKNLKPGGYVLCNDWHKTATKMRDKKDFKLIGIINTPNDVKGTESTFDGDRPERYWQKVETDEEFKLVDPDYYEYAKQKVEKKFGLGSNVVENIRVALGLGVPSKNGHHLDDFFVFKKL